MCRYSDSDSTHLDAFLSDWLYSVQPHFQKLKEHLQQWHHMRGETHFIRIDFEIWPLQANLLEHVDMAQFC